MIDPHVESALAFLRGHTRADLQFDEHLRSFKYVFGADGRLIAPVMVAMINAVDTVLFIPSNEDGAMEVMVTLEQFDERGSSGGASGGGEAADRWRIYHGEPDDVRWAFMSIDSARFESVVIDGDALQRPNPLAKDEFRICRRMNQDHAEDLSRLCAHFASFNVEKPVMVGIDPMGLDVRARFDIVRVPAIESMSTPEQATRVLAAMSRQAGAVKIPPS